MRSALWADAFGEEVYHKSLVQVQRQTVWRMMPVKHVFSELVVMLVAPVASLAKDRKTIYKREGGYLRELVVHEEGHHTLNKWQLSLLVKRVKRQWDYVAHWQLRSVAKPKASKLCHQYKNIKVRLLDSLFCNRVLDEADHTCFLVEGGMGFSNCFTQIQGSLFGQGLSDYIVLLKLIKPIH